MVYLQTKEIYRHVKDSSLQQQQVDGYWKRT